MDKKIRTAVYAGSFNPMHIGHEAVIKSLSAEFDKVMVIVTPKNPLKGDMSEDNYYERLSNAKERVGRMGLKNVVFDDIQKKMGPPYHSLILLNVLSERNPNETFYLAIGSDCLGEFDKWHRWDEILNKHSVVVIPRKGYGGMMDYLPRLCEMREEDSKKWRIVELFSNAPEISSTEIRKNPEKYGY